MQKPSQPPLQQGKPTYPVANLKELPNSLLTVASVNVQSLTSKLDRLRIELLPKKIDVLALQEIWQIQDFCNYSIDGYTGPITALRKGRGGGVALYIKKDLNIEMTDTSNHLDNVCETITVTLEHRMTKYTIVNIYKPPQASLDLFLQRLTTTVEPLVAKNTIVLGDFNINLLNEASLPVKELNKLMAELSLTQSITCPTRTCSTTSTLIDHIWTNIPRAETAITNMHLADHDTTIIMIPKMGKTQKPKNLQQSAPKIKITDDNIDMIKSELMKAEIPARLNGKNAQQAFTTFHQILIETLLKTASANAKPKKAPLKPAWLTWPTWNLRKDLDTMHKKLKSTQIATQEDKAPDYTWSEYRKKRKEANAALKRDKINYFNKEIENAADPKKAWSLLNDLLKRKTKGQEEIDHLTIDDRKVTDNKEIAENINHYFANVGSKLDQKLPKINKSPTDYLTQTSAKFKAEPISIGTLKKSIRKLPNKTSSGTDGISNMVLKTLEAEIALPLTIVVNKCLEEGYLPNELKTAKVIYLFKAGDKSQMGNYRPISLLPTISKVIEKIFTDKMQQHLENNELWYKDQYGFRANKSTIHALARITDTIESSQKQGKFVIMIALDVAKAFNCLNKDILTDKLPAYGFQPKESAFVEDFLSDRKQISVVNGVTTGETPIDMGVPQGGCLSAPCYTLYNNDMPNAIKDPSNLAVMYADDSTLLAIADTLEEAITKANIMLKQVGDWYQANRLTLNAKKTQFMVFCPKGQQAPSIDLFLQGTKIEQVGTNFTKNTTKLLGIEFDEKLKFKKHIEKVTTKIRKAAGLLCMYKRQIPQKSKLLLYNAILKSHLDYGLVLWGPHTTKSQAEAILKIQKKAARAVINAPPSTHANEIFQHLGILKFQDMINLEAAKMAHDINTGKAPSALKSTKNHSHFTRGSNISAFPGTLRNTIESADPLDNLSTSSKTKILAKSKKKAFLNTYKTNCRNKDCTQCAHLKKILKRPSVNQPMPKKNP